MSSARREVAVLRIAGRGAMNARKGEAVTTYPVANVLPRSVTRQLVQHGCMTATEFKHLTIT